MELLFIHVRIPLYHQPLGILRPDKARLFVQPMRIPCEQNPLMQPLQFRVCGDRFHHPLAQTTTTILFQDEHVADIGKRGIYFPPSRRLAVLIIVENRPKDKSQAWTVNTAISEKEYLKIVAKVVSLCHQVASYPY